MSGIVDLYSDTQTRPTAPMRQALANAEVGDDQQQSDPTVNKLVERVADLLGHEAAVFMPSGTMCNQIGLRLHVRPGGDEVLLDRTAHPLNFEAGGAAAMSGALFTPLDGDAGIFSADQVRAAVRPVDRGMPRTRVVSVEQPTNIAGGRVWPLEAVQAVLAAAGQNGMRTHLDGARLMNAVVASGVPADQWAAGFDTAWIDFTKGLGAPFGAVIAGSAELMDETWRYKQMLGGAMRQAGIMAAACLYALDHHVDRLADDHANAKRLAEGLVELPGVRLDPAAVETNIVVFGMEKASEVAANLEDNGVRVSVLGPDVLRAVTHLDVDTADVDRALVTFAKCLA